MEEKIYEDENRRLMELGINIYIFDELVDGYISIIIREEDMKETSLKTIIDAGYEPMGRYTKKKDSYMFIINKHKLEKIHSE